MYDKKGKFQFPLSLVLVFINIALISLTSCCKKHENEDEYIEPVNVSNSTGDAWYTPSLTIDSKGSLYLVWTEDTTGGFDKQQIFYASKPTDGDWSVLVNLSNTSKSARMPFIAADKNDNLHLVWQQWIYDTLSGRWGWAIFYKYRNNDIIWTEPETIYWNLLSSQPTLCIDNSGNVHLAWLSYTGSNYYITYAMRTNDGQWTTPQVIFNKQVIDYISLCVDESDNLHLLFNEWTVSSTDTASLYYVEKPKNGNWSEPKELFSLPPPYYDIRTPTMVVDSDGLIHASWMSLFFEDSSYCKANFYTNRTATEEWTNPIPILFSDTINPQPASCGLMSDPTGLYLLWEDRNEFYYSSKKNGVDWSKPICIKVRDYFPQSYLKAAIDLSGTIHIVWVQYTGFEQPKEVYYCSFKP
jgi:hypothetical protein